MILVCTSVSDNRELDRVTITEKSVSYKTGEAKSIIDGAVQKYGRRATMELFSEWSNGYVQFSERV